jgi:hypothetical protein
VQKDGRSYDARRIPTNAAKVLNRHCTIPIALPEFAIRALEHRVQMTLRLASLAQDRLRGRMTRR